LTVGLDQTIAQRYSFIANFSGTPLEAAAIACRSKRPDKAVGWLEQGRCLVWSQLTQSSNTIGILKETRPRACKRSCGHLKAAGGGRVHEMPNRLLYAGGYEAFSR
jgi:hypothetical protein